MKSYKYLLALTAIFFLASCSDNSADNTQTEIQPPVNYEDSALPDEFVFPGEAPLQTESTASQEKDTASYADKAKSIAEYIAKHIDFSYYEAYMSQSEDGCIIDCIPAENADIPFHSIPLSINAGTEKLDITFPVSTESLLEKGFTFTDEQSAAAVAIPGEETMFTLCTSETKEMITFITVNNSIESISVKEAEISGVMLTSFNNFEVNGFAAKNDLGVALDFFGHPNAASVNVNGEECSVMLIYGSGENTASLTVLADGDTKEVIAVCLTVG